MILLPTREPNPWPLDLNSNALPTELAVLERFASLTDLSCQIQELKLII